VEPSSEADARIAVWILGAHPLPDRLLEPILWGLEEEGIPAETRPPAAGSAEAMAKQAADGSPLNVGIGVSEGGRAVALHHRDLPAARPLFVLAGADLEPAPLRRLGTNAARLVKGNPLAVGDGDRPAVVGEPSPLPPTAEASRDLVAEIASLVVARLLSDGGWRPQPPINDVPRRRTA
jgi:hypothetical protein